MFLILAATDNLFVIIIQAECFNKDEYAKHLIGNAFSIPTITMLLRPLQQMYSSCKYDGYDYEYYWIPYLEASNTTTTNNNSSLE